MTINHIQIFGWIGAIVGLIAYFLVSNGKLKGESLAFQAMNIIGAIFLAIYTYECKAYASVIVNLTWILIGLNTLVKTNKIKMNYAVSKSTIKYMSVFIAFLAISTGFVI